MKPPDGQGVAG